VAGKSKQKLYAFFSSENHNEWCGKFTETVVEVATRRRWETNYVGPAIGGWPGWIQNGKIKRPPNFDTYVLIGEIGPGKFVRPVIAEANRGEARRQWLKPFRDGRVIPRNPLRHRVH